MSSEESDDSGDMMVRPLPWLKRWYRKAFKKIDASAMLALSNQSNSSEDIKEGAFLHVLHHHLPLLGHFEQLMKQISR